MNVSKLILSTLRNGDFAHPGEIEAIQLAMNCVPKNPQQLLLDVGCGLGGTADYLQQNGWGKVTGIDIDSDVLNYAKQHHPQVQFFLCDVVEANKLFHDKKFNIIYCFSSFFCFSAQQASLTALSQIAAANCQLIIFDYSVLGNQDLKNPFSWPKSSANFHPIDLSKNKELLQQSGWKWKNSVDITEQFKTWYENLIEKFDEKRNTIIQKFDEGVFTSMYNGYTALLSDIAKKKVGGTIVYADYNKN